MRWWCWQCHQLQQQSPVIRSLILLAGHWRQPARWHCALYTVHPSTAYRYFCHWRQPARWHCALSVYSVQGAKQQVYPQVPHPVVSHETVHWTVCVHYSWVHPSTAVSHEGSIPEWCALLLGTPKYLTQYPMKLYTVCVHYSWVHPSTPFRYFVTDANELDDNVPSVQVFVSNSDIYVHGDVCYCRPPSARCAQSIT